MTRDYPNYFLDFKCIGGACEDSCCIGWEVDIDEDSYYYYQTLEGPFGDLIRSRIRKTPEGDYYFPMVEHKRCPFLNKDNLCDMILALGDQALCVTCDEYPRYFNTIGDYEQIDISLSCMEVGRLLFTNPEPVQYLSEDDSYDKSHLESFQDTDSADTDEADILLRDSIIRERDQMIAILQDRTLPIEDRISRVVQEGCCNKVKALWAEPVEWEDDSRLMQIFKPLQPIDQSWRATYRDICAMVENESSKEEAERLFFRLHEQELPLWFEKLAVYFTFRYQLDSYYDMDSSGPRRLTLRSLRMIRLMLLLRWESCGRKKFSVKDMIDVAHIYSRQVEHCEENVDELKR